MVRYLMNQFDCLCSVHLLPLHLPICSTLCHWSSPLLETPLVAKVEHIRPHVDSTIITNAASTVPPRGCWLSDPNGRMNSRYIGDRMLCARRDLSRANSNISSQIDREAGRAAYCFPW